MSLTEEDTDIDLSYLADDFKTWLDKDGNRDDLSLIAYDMEDDNYNVEQLSKIIMIITLDNS